MVGDCGRVRIAWVAPISFGTRFAAVPAGDTEQNPIADAATIDKLRYVGDRY